MRRLAARAAGPGFALALHAGLLAYLFVATPPTRPPAPPKAPIRIRAVAQAPKPVPPEPAPAIAEPTPPAPLVEPKAVARPASKRPQRIEAPKLARREPAPAAPIPSPEPPPAVAQALAPEPAAAPAKPRKFTVALGATVSTGGVAVPVSQRGSTWGVGGGGGVDPDDEEASSGGGAGGVASSSNGAGRPRRADVAEVSSLPKLLDKPTDDEMRALYPLTARKERVEGDVSLRLLVGTTGEVLQVRVVKPAGSGFDEAALAIVKRFRFRAAETRGEPVEVWIPWTYKFRLEG
jgi:TonB family protein